MLQPLLDCVTTGPCRHCLLVPTYRGGKRLDIQLSTPVCKTARGVSGGTKIVANEVTWLCETSRRPRRCYS